MLTAGVAALLYSAVAVLRHVHFRTQAFDLGIFDQAIWHYSRFEAPASTIRGEANLLGDHFHPILALAAPAYWLGADVRGLLVLQAVLLAASSLPLYRTAQQLFGTPPAVLWACAYLLSWGLLGAVAFDFHEIAFAVPLIALACAFVLAGRFGAALAPILALLLVKEELSLLVAAYGVVYLLYGRRRTGAALVAGGLAALLVLTKVVMPALAGGRAFAYWNTTLGDTAGEVVRTLVLRPWQLVTEALQPAGKLRTVFFLLAPFGFLSLLSPLVVLLAPLLAVRLYSANPYVWTHEPRFHYDATAIPVLAFAALDGTRRLRDRFGLTSRAVLGMSAGLVVLAVAGSYPTVPFRDLMRPSHWSLSEEERQGRELVERVPADAAVLAHDAIAPHLARRQRIWVLPIFPEGRQRGIRPPYRAPTRDADVVAVNVALPLAHETSPDELRRWLATLSAQGFAITYSQGPWALYERNANAGRTVPPSTAVRAFIDGS